MVENFIFLLINSMGSEACYLAVKTERFNNITNNINPITKVHKMFRLIKNLAANCA